jgi:hypothetical protein
MYDATNYSHKIPAAVHAAMKSFTGLDCLLVNRFTGSAIEKKEVLNCHGDVKQVVDKLGGSALNGWLLDRNRGRIDKGIWAWTFHSVWLTSEQKLVDITEDPQYIDSDYTTFWPDSTRMVDLAEGVSYNSVAVLKTDTIAKEFGRSVGRKLQCGEVYWITADFGAAKRLDEHSGQCRWLSAAYPDNIKKMETDYNVKVVDGEAVLADGSKFNVDIYFDYSVLSNQFYGPPTGHREGRPDPDSDLTGLLRPPTPAAFSRWPQPDR